LSGGDQERNEERFISTKVHKRKTPVGKRTKLGIELEESGREILAHLKGKAKLPTRRIVLPDEVDVRRIRNQTGMSQGDSHARSASIPEHFRNGNKAAGNRMRQPGRIWPSSRRIAGRF
jgi:translation initiation factor IF-1